MRTTEKQGLLVRTSSLAKIVLSFKRINALLLTGVMSAHLFAATVSAQEDAVIAKVVAAYGGKALINAENISIYNNAKRLYREQGQSAHFTEVFQRNVSFTIDFINRRKNLTEWESKERGDRLTQMVFDGSNGRSYDLYHHTYTENNGVNYSNLGSHIIRSHDTLLAHTVWHNKDSVTYVEEAMFRAEPHEKLLLVMGAGVELTLFINKNTGLISKMTRENDYVGQLTYVFSNYQKTDGVTYASDFQLNIAGEPEVISTSRNIKVNHSLESVFAKPQSFTKRGDIIDTSKMKVWVMDQGVYYVGQGHRFSLFIDSGKYFVAAGGNSGLKARFEALLKATSVDKPLKYQVVTHHHSDHLAGMNDAADLGAIFITVADHITALQNAISQPLPKNRFLLVNEKSEYGGGIAKIHYMSSTHSKHNLLLYAPRAKVMFTADHFSSDLKTELPNPDKGTVILRNEIMSKQLDIERFVGAHGARVLTLQDLHSVANSYRKKICPTGIIVCA